MEEQDNLQQEQESFSIQENTSGSNSSGPPPFVDNRPEALEQRQLQQSLGGQSMQFEDNRPEALEQKLLSQSLQNTGSKEKNNTGIPDQLKTAIEKLSGYSLSDVKVHYNSDKPAQFGALAYAQGTDIYIAPGQEEYLAHEVWHIIQQKEGRVAKTSQLQGGTGANEDDSLEQEAAMMGDKALSGSISSGEVPLKEVETGSNMPIQRAETLAHNIMRILEKRGIYIADEDAEEYAKLLEASDPNTEIQVVGHHRALKMNTKGLVSSIKRRPPSSAAHMRVSPEFGPMEEEASSMISTGRFPLTGEILSQDTTITADMLKTIPPRPALNPIMGGSAAKLSKVANSEWLHAIAHSLGGEDAAVNLAAGPHSLNTAMIPFETLVKELVFSGIAVDYSVTFYMDYLEEHGINYIHAVEIGIQVPKRDMGFWTLSVNPKNIAEFINGQVFNEIKQTAQEYAASLKQ